MKTLREKKTFLNDADGDDNFHYDSNLLPSLLGKKPHAAFTS